MKLTIGALGSRELKQVVPVFAESRHHPTDGLVYTTSNHGIGTPHQKRRVVIGAVGSGLGTGNIISVKLNDIEAELHRVVTNSYASCAIASIEVPEGTTGSLTVEFDASAFRFRTMTWAMNNCEHFDDAGVILDSNPTASQIFVPQKGALVMFGFGHRTPASNNISGWTPTGATLDTSAQMLESFVGIRMQGASEQYANAQEPLNIGGSWATPGTLFANALMAASFAPK